MLSAVLMVMVIYLYTVIAFNFFRKFYRQSTPEGSEVYNCDSMFQVREKSCSALTVLCRLFVELHVA